MASNNFQNIVCRLCDGPSAEKFSLHGLPGEITYFECANCRSLQTQEPIWLSNAYGRSNLSDADTGAAQRVLGNQAFILLAAKILRIQTVLDFGGGDGLLCRLLRDRGLDAYTIDSYAVPTYASLFEGNLENNYDLITAFEVFEHLSHPSAVLDELFQANPKYIIETTELYSGQDASWWYLAPQQGQHVFFYSQRALQMLAARHKYGYHCLCTWHLFARQPITRPRLLTLKCLSSSRLLKLFRATLPFSETWHWIHRDFSGASGNTRRSGQDT